MLEKLVLFTHNLRKAGFSVSLNQVTTAMEALSLVDLDAQTFKVILRAVFAKTHQEIQVFEKVFSLYFGAEPEVKNTVEWASVDEIGLKLRAGGCDGKGVGRSGIGGSQGNFLVSILDEAQATALAKSLVSSLEWDNTCPRPVGAYWEQLKRDLDWYMLKYQVEEKLDLTESERLFILEKMEAFASLVEHYLCQELAAREGQAGVSRILEELNYEQQDFRQLNEAGLEIIEQQVKKLGRKLASRKGYRYAPSTQGRIDVKRTLKGAVLRGGVPAKLKRKKRRIERPELLVLCDISNSMSQYTQFLLLLIWTLQTKHKRIRSFVFVDRLAEVTHLLQGREALEGLRFIGIHAPCSATGFTDYGRVFRDFAEGYLHDLHGKMKLLILGDGKNNWRDPQVDAFKAIADGVGGVFWLNPRPQNNWYDNDSVLGLYRLYCKGIYKCSNLAELKRVSSLIV